MQMVRPGAGISAGRTVHANAFQDRDPLRRIAALPGRDQCCQRPQSAFPDRYARKVSAVPVLRAPEACW